MAFPTDLNFSVAFDLTNDPANFALTDTTPYVADGLALADVRGNFTSVVDPLGNIIHANSDYSSPDITRATSALYTGLDIPTDTAGDILEGQYSFTYGVRTDAPIVGVNQGLSFFTIVGNYGAQIVAAGSITVVRSTGNNATYTVASTSYAAGNTAIVVNEAILSATVDGSIQYSTQTVYSKTIVSTYADSIPAVNISVETDCFCGVLKSVDKTNYGTATISSRTHTVKYPAALSIADIVSSNATITVSPIYTKTWVTIVTSVISIPISNGTITATITGSKETDVECDLTLCDISCCVLALNNRYLDNRTDNPVLADKDFKDLTRMMQLIEMFQMFTSCSQNDEASDCLTEIKKLGNCSDKCQCNEDEPNLVVPLCSSGGGSNINVISGTGIVVTVALSGGTYTYQISLAPSILSILNSVYPQNIIASTGISVAQAMVGGVQTWTITNTSSFTAENRMEFLCRIQYSVPGAPVCTITNSAYLYSGTNMNATATVANSTIGSLNGKNLNNLFKVSAFQVASNNNYKVSIQPVFLGVDLTVMGFAQTVSAANMYNLPNIARLELINKSSGNFDFRFVDGNGNPITNNIMNIYPDIIVNIKISQ